MIRVVNSFGEPAETDHTSFDAEAEAVKSWETAVVWARELAGIEICSEGGLSND